MASKGTVNEKQKVKANTDALKKLIDLGNASLKKGDKLEARHKFQEAIDQFPNDPEGFLSMGNVIFTEQSCEAADFYNQALDVDPRNGMAYIGLAKAYLKLNSESRADDAINRAVQLDEKNPEVQFFAGLTKYYTHNYANALFFLQQAAQADANVYTPFAKFMIGLLLANQSNFTKALDSFKSCVGLKEFSDKNSPNYPALLNNLGLVQFRIGAFADAEKTYGDLTSAFPKSSAQFWLNFAEVYWMQDKVKEAVVCYEKANAIKAGSWPWMNELAEYQKSGAAGLKAQLQKLKKEGKQNIAIYLGCIIPNRYPFIEVATRHFLDAFDIGVKDLEGAGCCPAPGVFRSFDINTWMTVGARNIVISEQLNRNLVTMCNGCYGTLNDINTELKHDSEKKDMVNSHLKKINKEFKGNVDVRHVIEMIYYDIGIENLKKKMTNPLTGLNLAVHYGCHVVKPHGNKPWTDSPESPTFLDQIVETTGAKSIAYKDKFMCCGAGGGVRGALKEVALDFTRDKLTNMREAGVDALVLCCPFCAMQFDLGQNEINQIFKDKIGEPFRFPVIYITQLLGLGMGMDPYKLGLLKAPKPKGVPPFQPYESIFTRFSEPQI